jgi:hypothetical protein
MLTAALLVTTCATSQQPKTDAKPKNQSFAGTFRSCCYKLAASTTTNKNKTHGFSLFDTAKGLSVT